MSPASGVAAATLGEPGVLERLREATRYQHRRLNHHPLLRELPTAGGDAADYVRTLQALLGFYGSLEPQLIAALQDADQEALYERPFRSEWLEEDLRRLGHRGIASHDHGLPLVVRGDGPAALAGVLYVVEGSALGGQVIARGWSGEAPHRYFSGHADRTAARWARVRSWIKDFCAEEPRIVRATQAAKQTFIAVEACLDAAVPKSRPSRHIT